MKIFCLLISIFFVNVLADEHDDYLNYVYLTTGLIQLAYLKDLTVEGRPGANGLEHQIEKMVDDINNVNKYQNFRKICFLMAVPDHLEILLEVQEPPPRPYPKANQFLAIMVNELESIVGMRIHGLETDDGSTLEGFINMIREFVAWSIKRLIRSRILGSQQDVLSLPNCRLLGLYWSTQSPNSYIVEVNVDSTAGTCILKNVHDDEKKYSKIEGTWSEIYENGHVRESLERQLERGQPLVAPT
ncbi:uncharacterized protein LOC126845178 isoform X2 [Adelges cooleyi]|uniref:uncharacterized protein LOC126845178 isoform X2 n=1 Tax=Adelges cooleyi TaxID=133065 RepID=UPI00217F3482|nr:uncharacterized protein LOC126845178 isoform X2 [Adelges cooleyi]